MLVITDSTALIRLDRIDKLDLLPKIYPNIVAPRAVVEEFGRRPEWLTVVAVRDVDAVCTVRAQLDAGEAEAIVLALENEGCTLLIDERRGRRYAIQLGLSVVGTFGILIRAKQSGQFWTLSLVLDFALLMPCTDERLRRPANGRRAMISSTPRSEND
jgi:uncharacterized protein